MESVKDTAPDPEDLWDDLVKEMRQLQADLKMLGIDMVHIPDFLKETGRCPDSKTTEADRPHDENEEPKYPFELNKGSGFDIGSFDSRSRANG